MTAKVIQGSFLSGQPKFAASVQSRIAAAPPIQIKTAVRSPRPPAVAARAPGPPAPAFAGRSVAVQRHGSGGAFAVEAGPLGLASGGGRALPETVRGKMEAALNADFSNVRVHVGPQAERIGAIAFTTGNDIYFAPGRYQPETLQGLQLLGHELAHVVQQRAGRVRNPLGSGLAVVQDHALETEADRMGQRAAAHRVAAQPKMHSGAQQPSAPVTISASVSGGSASYRRSAVAGGHQVGPVAMHARGSLPSQREVQMKASRPSNSATSRLRSQLSVNRSSRPGSQAKRVVLRSLPTIQRMESKRDWQTVPIFDITGRTTSHIFRPSPSSAPFQFSQPNPTTFALAEPPFDFSLSLNTPVVRLYNQTPSRPSEPPIDAGPSLNTPVVRLYTHPLTPAASQELIKPASVEPPVAPQIAPVGTETTAPSTVGSDKGTGWWWRPDPEKLSKVVTKRIRIFKAWEEPTTCLLDFCPSPKLVRLFNACKHEALPKVPCDPPWVHFERYDSYRARWVEQQFHNSLFKRLKALIDAIAEWCPELVRQLRSLTQQMERTKTKLSLCNEAWSKHSAGDTKILSEQLKNILERLALATAAIEEVLRPVPQPKLICQIANCGTLGELYISCVTLSERTSNYLVGISGNTSVSQKELSDGEIKLIKKENAPPTICYGGIIYRRIPSPSNQSSIIYGYLNKSAAEFKDISKTQMDAFERILYEEGLGKGSGVSGVKQETAGEGQGRRRWWVIKVNWNEAHHLEKQQGESVSNVSSPLAEHVQIGDVILLNFKDLYKRH